MYKVGDRVRVTKDFVFLQKGLEGTVRGVLSPTFVYIRVDGETSGWGISTSHLEKLGDANVTLVNQFRCNKYLIDGYQSTIIVTYGNVGASDPQYYVSIDPDSTGLDRDTVYVGMFNSEQAAINAAYESIKDWWNLSDGLVWENQPGVVV